MCRGNRSHPEGMIASVANTDPTSFFAANKVWNETIYDKILVSIPIVLNSAFPLASVGGELLDCSVKSVVTEIEPNRHQENPKWRRQCSQVSIVYIVVYIDMNFCCDALKERHSVRLMKWGTLRRVCTDAASQWHAECRLRLGQKGNAFDWRRKMSLEYLMAYERPLLHANRHCCHNARAGPVLRAQSYMHPFSSTRHLLTSQPIRFFCLKGNSLLMRRKWSH